MVVTHPPRAVGACIVNRTDELKESDVGTECGLFEVRKIGDEYFAFLVECKSPKACTILLRGASKDILNEVWEGEGRVRVKIVVFAARERREEEAVVC